VIEIAEISLIASVTLMLHYIKRAERLYFIVIDEASKNEFN
jgi:hypothetical protein